MPASAGRKTTKEPASGPRAARKRTARTASPGQDAAAAKAPALGRRGNPAGRSASRPAGKTAGGPAGPSARKPAVQPAGKAAAGAGAASAPRLLSGGNPQVAKADGDGPVQAYIAAMPEWKQDVGRRLDRLVAENVPGVRKAVRWNSPLYGVAGQGWFLSFHVFTRYVKVTFFRGVELTPQPQGGAATQKHARWVDVHEGGLDEAQMADWIRQAAAIPGWDGGSPRLYGGVAL